MTTWLSALDIPGLIFVCVFVALLVLVILQGNTIRALGLRLGRLETWGHRTDPRYFGIYPDLEPDPPVEECAGPHPVAADGRTCSVCGLVLVP